MKGKKLVMILALPVILMTLVFGVFSFFTDYQIKMLEAQGGVSLTLSGDAGIYSTDQSGYIVMKGHTGWYGSGERAGIEASVKEGYSFSGWYEGTVKISSGASDTVVVNTCKNLEARTNKNTYTISYDLKGGAVSGNPTGYNVETAAFTLKNPVKDGYIFDGWTGSSGELPQTSVRIAKGSTGNRSYTANWTPVTYKIIYHANGGIGTTVESAHTFDSEKSLTANGFTKKGYLFGGWNTDKDGSGISYGDLEKVKNLAAADGDTVILYAQWNADAVLKAGFMGDYINLSGITEVVFTDKTAPSGVSVTDVSEDDGGSVVSWTEGTVLYVSSRVAGKYIYANSDSSRMLEKQKLDSVDFGKLDTGIVTDLSDMFFLSQILKITLGDKFSIIELNGCFPETVSGYWYNSKGKAFAPEKIPGNTADTYYAEAPAYTVKFYANGGSTDITSRKVTMGDKYGTLPVPIRKGYTFDGWYTNAEGGTIVSASTVMGQGDVSVYAHWTRIESVLLTGQEINMKLKSISASRIDYLSWMDSVPEDIDTNSSYIGVTDLSLKQDRSILAWYNSGDRTIYIGSYHAIIANTYCSNMFSNFDMIEIYHSELLDMRNVCTIDNMYYNCVNLRGTVHLKNMIYSRLNQYDSAFSYAGYATKGYYVISLRGDMRTIDYILSSSSNTTAMFAGTA